MITYIFSRDNNTAKIIYSSLYTFIHDKRWTENIVSIKKNLWT